MPNELIEAMARGIMTHRSPLEGDMEWRLSSDTDRDWYRGLATAAYAALREKLVPVGWRYTKLDAGVERKAIRDFQVADAVSRGWTETPLYHLPEIKDAD